LSRENDWGRVEPFTRTVGRPRGHGGTLPAASNSNKPERVGASTDDFNRSLSKYDCPVGSLALLSGAEHGNSE
jgi:hypothetical protein